MRTLTAITRASIRQVIERASLIALACVSSRASAHPAAAVSPTFLDAPCVIVADKREQDYLDIEYTVLVDDTVIESGDIPVTDAKTHQFFAVSGTIYQEGVDDIFIAFDEPDTKGVLFPLWITHSDVQRSAAAVEMATGVTQEQTDLPPNRVLESRTDLDKRWLRITQDDARRPITASAARLPVRWQLADVAPGAYTVSGYVFSPPYNAWAARAGVVKVIDADHNPAAGAMMPVNEVVFAYQGRRVKGCVDVPEGTTLDAYYFMEERPEMGWVPWIEGRRVESGELDQCFHMDRTDIAGSIRLRWDLHAPGDGPVTSVRSKDTFTWLQGSGECKESESHCCDFPMPDAPPRAGSGGAGGAGAAAAAAGSGGGGAKQVGSPAAESGGGCTVAAGRAQRTPLGMLLLTAALLGLRRHTRARRS
jgi:hypothetical protein